MAQAARLCCVGEIGTMYTMLSQDLCSFLFVIFVQAAIFVGMALLGRVEGKVVVKSLKMGAAIGIPLGFAFDLIIGDHRQVFTYVLPPTLIFLLANSILSYGLAIATIVVIRQDKDAQRKDKRFGVGSLLIISAIGIAIILRNIDAHLILAMFMIGAVVILGGEGASLFLGKTGPLLEALHGNWGEIARLWLASISLGIIYETANTIWPVWRWGAATLLPMPWWSITLILFGYFVLFHPIWQLVDIFTGSADNTSDEEVRSESKQAEQHMRQRHRQVHGD